MYLYVTNDQSLCGGGTLAYSLPCLYDWKSNRPQAANLNICTDGLSGSVSDSDLGFRTADCSHAYRGVGGLTSLRPMVCAARM